MQLKSHHAKQLLIAMHEAPGNDYRGNLMWKAPYLAEFLKILSQYQSQYQEITLLTSHSHMDEIRHIALPDGHSIYGFSTPSVSRIYHNNAAMKIFDLDLALRVKNFTTFYTSTNKTWGNEKYHALGTSPFILPNCQNKTLAQCLAGLNKDQVCTYIERGMYYSVKGKKVSNRPCLLVYDVKAID